MWRRLLLLVACLGTLLAHAGASAQAGAPARADARPVLRIVAADFVLPAKFEPMARWAAEAGYAIDWRTPATAGPDVARGAAMLLMDGPRPSDMAAVTKAVGDTDRIAIPWLRIGGGPPGSANLPPDTARRLIGYYAGGGEDNLRLFVQAAARVLAGGSLADLPPPRPMPKTGLYHPDAPAPFATPDAFRAWAAAREGRERPVVAFAISDGQWRDMQMAVPDALAKAAAARGVMPVFVWYDESDPQALTKMLRPLRAQALVNLTHMQSGEARRAEFEALDIPVMQGVIDRAGTPDQWRARSSGIPAMAAAVMLSQPEGWGVSDPIVVGAVEQGAPVPIPEQVELMAAKLARLAALRAMPAHDKHLALFFWNHPVGEKNLAASNLNLPRSLAKLTGDLAAAGYDVSAADEGRLIADAQAMLGGLYRPGTLATLAARGLAARLPVATYRRWLDTIPPARRAEVIARWGDPAASPAVRDGAFIIPRLSLGKLTILPQPPRGGDALAAYHDLKQVPDHRYLATYLWARAQGGGAADALIHFGTHGTQEWTPGKDRGLWAGDYPFLTLGDVPVFYPYVQDNVAEAIQARRRGRAVTISHQTPPFAPSGLYDELSAIAALIRDYEQLEPGAIRDRVADGIRAAARAAHLDADMGWSAAVARDFAGYYRALQDHLDTLAGAPIPLGLHIFGLPASPDDRLTTVLQQLGPDYLAALKLDPATALAADPAMLRASLPYRTLARYLREGGDPATIADPALRRQIERATGYDRNLAEPGETEALLAALAGRFVRAGPGGDPVREPEVPSGRNLYAFEADKVPTPAAYAEGGRALDRLIEAYRARHSGAMPRKLAFSTFSGETIRTLGVGEGQILHALGLKPVWGRGGRVERLEIVPASELGRPRIDVVMQPTSVYRDQFDGFMRLLADGIDRIASLDEADGPAANARALERRLVERGVAPDRARALSRLRIFTNAPGDYGTGLPDRIVRGGAGRPDDWTNEKDLAEPFLERMQYAYGARDWGLKPQDAGNLFAEQLRGVDAAVLMRSSNVHGLLSTDHPFEHLGGLSLAIRSLTGRAPDLYVTDMRGRAARVATAGAFLSDELRSRYLNPQWIGAMQAQGYAGATVMLDIVNNLFGWQVADPASVRADQWQAMHDTYVADARHLGLNAYFAQVHPTAQLQMVDRLLEAVRRNYWKPDEATRRSLEQRRDILRRLTAAATARVVPRVQQGYGLAASATSASTAPAVAMTKPSSAPALRPPSGRVLERQTARVAPAMPATGRQLAAVITLLFLLIAGALFEARARARSSVWKPAHAPA